MPAAVEYMISVVGEDNFTPEVDKMLKELKSLEERASKKGIPISIDPSAIKELQHFSVILSDLEKTKVRIAPFDPKYTREVTAATEQIAVLEKEIRETKKAVQVAEGETRTSQAERLKLLKAELGIHKPIVAEFEKRYQALTKEEQKMVDEGKISQRRRLIEGQISANIQRRVELLDQIVAQSKKSVEVEERLRTATENRNKLSSQGDADRLKSLEQQRIDGEKRDKEMISSLKSEVASADKLKTIALNQLKAETKVLGAKKSTADIRDKAVKDELKGYDKILRAESKIIKAGGDRTAEGKKFNNIIREIADRQDKFTIHTENVVDLIKQINRVSDEMSDAQNRWVRAVQKGEGSLREVAQIEAKLKSLETERTITVRNLDKEVKTIAKTEEKRVKDLQKLQQVAADAQEKFREEERKELEIIKKEEQKKAKDIQKWQQAASDAQERFRKEEESDRKASRRDIEREAMAREKILNIQKRIIQEDKEIIDLAKQRAKEMRKMQKISQRQVLSTGKIVKAYDLWIDRTGKVYKNLTLVQQASKRMGEILRGVGVTLLRWIVIYRGILMAWRQLTKLAKDFLKTNIDIDRIQGEIAKVRPGLFLGHDAESAIEGARRLQQVTYGAFEIAGRFGLRIEDVSSSMTMFFQQGLNVTQALERTNAAMMLTSVTALKADKAVETITAAMKIYGDTIKDPIILIDALIAVEQKHAITAKTLSEALMATGNAAAEMGVNLNELLGYVTAIGVTTRDSGKKIGTALRFIFPRFFTPKAIKAIQQQNVALFKSLEDGTVTTRDLSDVIADLSVKWGELNKAERLHMAISIAGRRRFNQFLALMNNFTEALAANIDALTSSGRAMTANQAVASRLNRQIQNLRSSWQEFLFTVGQTGILVGVIRIVNNLRTGILAVAQATQKLPIFASIWREIEGTTKRMKIEKWTEQAQNIDQVVESFGRLVKGLKAKGMEEKDIRIDPDVLKSFGQMREAWQFLLADGAHLIPMYKDIGEAVSSMADINIRSFDRLILNIRRGGLETQIIGLRRQSDLLKSDMEGAFQDLAREIPRKGDKVAKIFFGLAEAQRISSIAILQQAGIIPRITKGIYRWGKSVKNLREKEMLPLIQKLIATSEDAREYAKALDKANFAGKEKAETLARLFDKLEMTSSEIQNTEQLLEDLKNALKTTTGEVKVSEESISELALAYAELGFALEKMTKDMKYSQKIARLMGEPIDELKDKSQLLQNQIKALRQNLEKLRPVSLRISGVDIIIPEEARQKLLEFQKAIDDTETALVKGITKGELFRKVIDTIKDGTIDATKVSNLHAYGLSATTANVDKIHDAYEELLQIIGEAPEMYAATNVQLSEKEKALALLLPLMLVYTKALDVQRNAIKRMADADKHAIAIAKERGFTEKAIAQMTFGATMKAIQAEEARIKTTNVKTKMGEKAFIQALMSLGLQKDEARVILDHTLKLLDLKDAYQATQDAIQKSNIGRDQAIRLLELQDTSETFLIQARLQALKIEEQLLNQDKLKNRETLKSLKIREDELKFELEIAKIQSQRSVALALVQHEISELTRQQQSQLDILKVSGETELELIKIERSHAENIKNNIVKAISEWDVATREASKGIRDLVLDIQDGSFEFIKHAKTIESIPPSLKELLDDYIKLQQIFDKLELRKTLAGIAKEHERISKAVDSISFKYQLQTKQLENQSKIEEARLKHRVWTSKLLTKEMESLSKTERVRLKLQSKALTEAGKLEIERAKVLDVIALKTKQIHEIGLLRIGADKTTDKTLLDRIVGLSKEITLLDEEKKLFDDLIFLAEELLGITKKRSAIEGLITAPIKAAGAAFADQVRDLKELEHDRRQAQRQGDIERIRQIDWEIRQLDSAWKGAFLSGFEAAVPYMEKSLSEMVKEIETPWKRAALEAAQVFAVAVGGVMGGGGRWARVGAAGGSAFLPVVLGAMGASMGPIGMFIGTTAGGIIGGLIGGHFDDLEDEMINNTMALQRNTQTLQELTQQFINVPPQFMLPAGIQTGMAGVAGGAVQGGITINISVQGGDAEITAREVARVLQEQVNQRQLIGLV